MSYDTLTLNTANTPDATTLNYKITMSGTGVPDKVFEDTTLSVKDGDPPGTEPDADGGLFFENVAGASPSVQNPPASVDYHTIDLTEGGTLTLADTFSILDGTSANTEFYVSNGGDIYAAPNTSVPRGALEGGFLGLEDDDALTTQPFFVFAGNVTACLHEDTLVETDNGTVAIKELSRGDLVRTYQDGYQPISRVLKSSLLEFHNFVVIEKNALSPCVPSEKFMLTKGHPIKYGDRYITAGGLVASGLIDSSLVYRAQVACKAYYNLQFDKHYTFSANGVETQSIPATTSYQSLALPENLFHDKSLYDASKIGDESTYLHSEKEIRLPLTREEVECVSSAETV